MLWHDLVAPLIVLEFASGDDSDGLLLPLSEERAELAEQRAQLAEQRVLQAEEDAQRERQKAAALAERLRALGIDPDTL